MQKFPFLDCVSYLSLVPILKPFWCRLVKLFETIVSPLEGETAVTHNGNG